MAVVLVMMASTIHIPSQTSELVDVDDMHCATAAAPSGADYSSSDSGIDSDWESCQRNQQGGKRREIRSNNLTDSDTTSVTRRRDHEAFSSFMHRTSNGERDVRTYETVIQRLEHERLELLNQLNAYVRAHRETNATIHWLVQERVGLLTRVAAADSARKAAELKLQLLEQQLSTFVWSHLECE